MTANQLIDALRQVPPHYPVIILAPDVPRVSMSDEGETVLIQLDVVGLELGKNNYAENVVELQVE